MRRMKKGFVAGMILAACVAICGCGSDGGDDSKVIEKEKIESSGAAGESGAQTGQTPDASSYFFYTAQTDKGSASVTVDMFMKDVLEKIGDPYSYFEAKSCAFDGLDKSYTYVHFEIDTYPAEDGDRISMICLLDDLTSTPEGLSIGDSKDKMEQLYGTNYELAGSEYVYNAGKMKLKIQVSSGNVSYISYVSDMAGAVLGNID